MTNGEKTTSKLSSLGLANLFIVYIVWSSTYLAIRIGVDPGSGFTPLAMGTIRLLAAGVILLGFAVWRGYRIRISLAELYVLTVTSVFLWVLCNGLVMWAEQRANSGFAALVLATTPLMVALLDYGLHRQKISKLLLASLFFGLGGVLVLMWPALHGGNTTDLMAGLTLFFAAFCWSAGTVFQSYHPLELKVAVTSAYQHLVGGMIFAAFMLISRESLPHASMQAWGAMLYLILFGSVLAFSAFISALNLLPMNITMTYSYINPVLALLLGWWLLDETITPGTLMGAAMVIAGVIGVFRDRRPEAPAESRDHESSPD